jgi:hypothetical protein
MSWDAVILKIRGPARPIAEVADDEYLPLGSLETVTQKIRAAFPNAEWTTDTYALWKLDDDTAFMIELQHVESSHSIHVSVSGGGNPIPCLVSLATANEWVVLDCGTSEFINAVDDSSEGWEGYNTLLRGLRDGGPAEG